MQGDRFTLGREKRLRGRGSFKTVLDARARAEGAAIAVHARPNEGSAMRLGISIGDDGAPFMMVKRSLSDVNVEHRLDLRSMEGVVYGLLCRHGYSWLPSASSRSTAC